MAPETIAQVRLQPRSQSTDEAVSPPPSRCFVQVGSRSERGRRRKNEDRCYASTKEGIYIVADGMGGQEDGERASGLAVELIPRSILDQLPNAKDVRTAVQEILRDTNEQIVEAGKHHPQGRRMGTTVVLAVEHRGLVHVTGIGDSRAYLVRDHQIKQITVDHTVADALERNGELSHEQAEQSPWKHILYKFLGNAEMRDKADVQRFTPKPGDRLVLATDGMTNYVPEADVLAGAESHSGVQEWVNAMVELALSRGSRDNVTCVALAFEPASAEGASPT